MPCSISCTLSLVFIISMIYMNRATTKSQTIQKYEQQLPQELKDIYRKIQQERQSIYYYGYALGFILSLIIIIYNYQKSSSHKTKLSTSHIVCIVVATSFITIQAPHHLGASPRREGRFPPVANRGAAADHRGRGALRAQ